MYNKTYVLAVYAERKYYYHMFAVITNMAEIEKGISPEFKDLLNKFQKDIANSYLEASDLYHEIVYEHCVQKEMGMHSMKRMHKNILEVQNYDQ